MLNFADATASAAHPFVGLRPFTFEDAAFFFGREHQVDALERRVMLGRMVAVVGSSGSGKSSLIRAGVLPRLSADAGNDEWDWVEMRPGEAPVRNLAEALARPNRTAGTDPADPMAEARADRIDLVLQQSSFGIGEALSLLRRQQGRRLLILVDQFEEIFRFADLRTQRNQDARRAAEQRDEATFFVQLLLRAVADESLPACIMLTMRSDFIGECARFHGLSEAVTQTQYLVPALTRDQRATAIRAPIALAGGICDPALIQRLLNDSNEDPDQLPVMQHAIMRCWQRAAAQAGPTETPRITLDHYRAVGGFEGAIAQHGDEQLAALTGDAPSVGLSPAAIAKHVFQSLTEVDSQGRVIRRPQTLADLVSVMAPDADPGRRPAMEAAVRNVVLHFADPACSFLRAPPADELAPDSIVDIGHEALIRRWERLGGLDTDSWVREEQNDAESYRQLLVYSLDGGLIPRGPLRGYEAWWAERKPTRFWARRYTRGGEDRLASAATLLRRSRNQVVRDRRVKRAAIAAVAILLAVSGGLMLNGQRLERERLADRAEQARRAAADSAVKQARLIAVEGVDELRARSAYQALLLAIHGLSPRSGLPTVPENESLAYEALSRMHERNIFTVGGCTNPAVAFMPDGALVTYAGGALQFWNTETGTPDPRRSVPGPGTAWASGLQPDPTGQYVLLSTQDQTFLVDLAARKSGELNPRYPRLGTGTFSPDGKLILTTGRNASPKLWSFAPNDSEPAGPPTTLLHDFANNPTPMTAGNTAAIGGQYLAIANGESGRIEIYEIDRVKWSKTLPFPATASGPADDGTAQHGVTGLAFDPNDSERLLASYQGASPRLWNLRTAEATTLESAAGNFSRAAFSPDGRYVAMVKGDERVPVWDTQNPPEHEKLRAKWLLRGSDGPFFSVAFDRQDRIATGSLLHTIWHWNTEAALSRGLPPPTAHAPDTISATPPATTIGVAGTVFTVRSTVPGVIAGPLGLPPNLIKPPIVTNVSDDGAWALLAPSRGPILLYDLRHPDSPVAALGFASANWSGAAFASNPDRIVGTPTAGPPQSWRYFPKLPDLLDFSRASLPLLDGGQAVLPETTQQKIDGQFWTVLSALKNPPPDGACAGDSGRVGARSTSTVSR